MSTSQAVAQHLPFLRRYARALTGSQQSGDAYVAAALEALIADRGALENARGPRVALYSLFTRIWNSVVINGSAEPPGDAKMPVEQRLGHITPLPRQAFLLVALEGFPEEDAASILGVDVSRLRTLVEESGRELAAEIATDVMIIEDETFIAMDLEGLVESLGHRVLGVARASFDGADWPQSQRDFAFEFVGLVGLASGRFRLAPVALPVGVGVGAGPGVPIVPAAVTATI